MRVLILLCLVLLRAAVSDERCDAIDATGNTNFDEDNELLQVNADHGSSHDSASDGECSRPVGRCVRVTTTSTYGPKKAFYNAVLKVGSKSEYGNSCILVNIDGSVPEKTTDDGIKRSLSGMSFDDTELTAAACSGRRQRQQSPAAEEEQPPTQRTTGRRQRSENAVRQQAEARAARRAARAAAQGEEANVPTRTRAATRKRAQDQQKATEQEDALKASRDAAAAASAAEQVARDTAAAYSDFVGGRSDVATMSHAEAARRKQAFDFLG